MKKRFLLAMPLLLVIFLLLFSWPQAFCDPSEEIYLEEVKYYGSPVTDPLQLQQITDVLRSVKLRRALMPHRASYYVKDEVLFVDGEINETPFILLLVDGDVGVNLFIIGPGHEMRIMGVEKLLSSVDVILS